MLDLFARLLRRPARIVTCPETAQPVAVTSTPRFVISSCSRWPERAGCDEACAPQIAAEPRGTLVTSIVTRWYRDKPCAYCGRRIGDIEGTVVPGLRGFDGELREWREVAPEQLPHMLSESLAVCARCELTESFRREHPELVTDRVETPLRNRAIY